MLQQLLTVLLTITNNLFGGALLVSIFVFPYFVLRIVKEKYSKVTNVKKTQRPMYIETKQYKLCKGKLGVGAVGFLMTKNLLKKNIIKASIDSSAKGV